MAYAITLRLDADAAASVVAMWRALASRGVSDEALRLSYPPHLTLAVLPDAADPDRLRDATRQCAAGWRGLKISLASLGVFPGSPATLFLAPVVTHELLERHASLLTALAGEPVDPHYRIGHFVPHVTLAGDLADPAAAIAVLDPFRLPLAAVLDAADVVRFRPVRVLTSHRLPAT